MKAVITKFYLLLILTVSLVFSNSKSYGQDTWYSYQSGNWNSPSTWTLDGSVAPLLINPSNEVPDATDDVVVTSGRTVTIDVDNITTASLEVEGRLVLSTHTGHNFNQIDGTGIIRMSGDGSGNDNFPAGTTTGANGFSNVNNGGILEMIGSGLNLDQTREFNDVKVILDNATDEAVLLSDYVINGNLTITRGVLKINDNSSTTALNIDLYGDMFIASNGELAVGTANARHEFNFYGDFTNNGTAGFSQRTTADINDEATDGIIDANFVSAAQDQTVACNNTTYFYRIEINKGTDDTYTLFLETTSTGNFNLTGPVDYQINSDVTTNDNALGLIAGTVSIGGDVVINPIASTGIYSVGSMSTLLVNGGSVAMDVSNSVVVYGTLEVGAGIFESNGSITFREAGLFKVTGGTAYGHALRTSTGGVANQGGVTITGGTVNIGLYSAADSPLIGSASGSYNSFENDYYTFTMPYSGQSFIMAGGTLNVYEASNSGLIFINSDPGNIMVTGGTVNAISSNGNEAIITSRASFYNLNIENQSSSSAPKVSVDGGTVGGATSADPITLAAQDLRVLNDIIIQTGTTRTASGSTYGSYLDLCPDGVNCVDLEVGGDLTIEDSAVLDFFTDDGDDIGSATLTFNGSGNATFYVGDITSYDATLTDYDDPDGDDSYVDYRLPVFNMVVDKGGDTLQLAAKTPGVEDTGAILTSGGGKNLDSNNARLLYIRDGLSIESGSTLSQIDPTGAQFGYIVRVYASTIDVDGNLLVYEQGVNPVNAFLEVREQDQPTVGDVILINSTDDATIGNIVVDLGNDELQLGNNLYVKRMAYRHGGVNLGTYNLKVDIMDFNTETSGGDDSYRLRRANGENIFGDNTSGAEQYFFTSGNASDGGLSIKVPRVTNVHGSDDTENVGFDPSYDEENNVYQNNNLLYYPIGVKDKYTPAVVYIIDAGTNVYDDDEYITVRPVDAELMTTDLNVASNDGLLDYYWNVDYEGFDVGGEPTVSWLFQYDDADAGNIGTEGESAYVPGKVLDGGAYSRSTDGDADAVKDGGTSGENGDIMGNDPENIIIFNGITSASDTDDDIDADTGDNVFLDNGSPNLNDDPVDNNWDETFPNVGFTLENANYTAGVADRFVGAPTVYYSRRHQIGGGGLTWTDLNDWSTDQVLQHGGAAASSIPGVGDIVVIGAGQINGSDEANDTGLTSTIARHQMVSVGSRTVSEVVFNSNPAGTAIGNNLSRIRLTSPTDVLSAGNYSGLGEIMLAISTSAEATVVGDLGDFNTTSNSTFFLDLTEAGTATFSSISEFPGIRIYGRNSAGRTIRFGNDISGQQILIDGMATLEVGNDIDIEGNVQLGNNREGYITFPDDGSNHTFTIGGDLTTNEPNTSTNNQINVAGTGSDIHTLQVGGDIDLQFGDQFDLSGATNVILEFIGAGTNAFTNSSAASPDLYQIVMNKGSDTSDSFTFNDNFSITDPGVTGIQPVEIVNGLLIFNDPAIDVTLSDDTGDFYLPNTNNIEASSGSGGLEVQQGTITIEGDDTGMILDGLLRVSGGTLDMSTGTGNDNNFIEYTSSGNAQFEVSSGTATIAGQVRRSTTSTTGILQYTQTGGTVTIAERNGSAESTRGVFEVVNDDSDFTHTGGDLIIVKSNNSTTVPSVLLDAETSDVSGSTITFANDAGNDNMGLKAGIALNNIILNGSAVAAPTVKLYQLPLTMSGDLTIDSDDSHNDIFDANGFNVTLTSGDFVNNGSFVSNGSGTDPQTFTFSGSGTQSLSGTGTSSFYNFTKSGAGTLTATVDIDISNELRIDGGTFATGAQSVNVLGDVINNATHTSSTEAAGTLYGIVMTGSEQQNIQRDLTGTSTFGTLAIDNPEGVLIEDETYYTFEVENKLILEQGVLDISSNLFVLNEDAVVENASGNSGVNDFTSSNMIQTNSSFTDFGLRKKFNTGVQTDFVFPIGQQLYTPVVLDMSANLAGSSPFITVRPSNEAHPTISDHDNSGSNSPGTLNDIQNTLQYHWIITSSGITSLTGDLSFEYDESDLSFLDPGDATATVSFNEANYAGARLLLNDTNWDKSFDESSVDDANNIIMFSSSDFSSGNGLNGGGDDEITGDYTAGLLRDDADNPLDVGAIPNTVPEYETVNTSGTFDDNTDWVAVNGSPVLGPGDVPTGAIITIKSGDEMTISSSNARIYRTVIESGATLTIDENASNTRLGLVEGTGNIKLSSSTPGMAPNLPAGYYADFFASDCSGGGLEYAGSVDYEVLSGVAVIREIIFSGSGDREMSNSDLTVCEDFILRDNVTFVNSNDRVITVYEDVIKGDNATIDMSQGSLILGGTSSQQIAGDFTGSEAFYNLQVNNSAGATVINSIADATNGISTDVDGDVEVTNILTLTDGIITTNAANNLIMAVTSSVAGGSDASHVNGPLIRESVNAASTYNFVVGRNGRYAPVRISSVGTGSQDWTAEYFVFNSNDPSMFDTSDSGFGSLNAISTEDLWRVTSAGSNSARIRLTYGTHNGVTDKDDLRVAHWDGSEWDNTGGVISGTNSSGTVLSQASISFSTQEFSIGTTGAPLPVSLLSFTGKRVGSSVKIEWKTSSELNNDYFEIEHSTDGVSFSSLGFVSGSGTTSEVNAYSLFHELPQVGYNFYKLKQVDYDGKSSYEGGIVSVQVDGFVGLNMLPFPNPTTADNVKVLININENAPALIEMFDLVGNRHFINQVSASELVSKEYELNLNANMAPGLYILKLRQGAESVVKRIMIKER